ncbi:DMT family transporter [Arenimonas fontis]|uniref:Guanidinium exporter n=1 Tax=Arenimonas fontis TaxID=2608255 RepID=A0A5B2ZAN3_9GAMM|nr:multidrug efflux SMR transporter [Arenimonas fontis]KAA2285005.1 multidrug efflux SMR transporter [Arenimonas fontis]
MAWVWLLAAGLLEIVWAWGLKASEGFTRPWPIVVTVLGTIASFWCLALALREIPLGTGYAVWVGIGALGTALLGIMLYGEPAAWPRLLCIALIVAGVVGLKFVG